MSEGCAIWINLDVAEALVLPRRTSSRVPHDMLWGSSSSRDSCCNQVQLASSSSSKLVGLLGSGASGLDDVRSVQDFYATFDRAIHDLILSVSPFDVNVLFWYSAALVAIRLIILRMKI